MNISQILELSSKTDTTVEEIVVLYLLVLGKSIGYKTLMSANKVSTATLESLISKGYIYGYTKQGYPILNRKSVLLFNGLIETKKNEAVSSILDDIHIKTLARVLYQFYPTSRRNPSVNSGFTSLKTSIRDLEMRFSTLVKVSPEHRAVILKATQDDVIAAAKRYLKVDKKTQFIDHEYVKTVNNFVWSDERGSDLYIALGLGADKPATRAELIFKGDRG